VKILISNWAASKTVTTALTEAGVKADEYDLTIERIEELFSYLVFEQQVDVKVIQRKDIDSLIMIVDDKKFRKRNPKAHRKLGGKKRRGPIKQYDTKKYELEEVLPFIRKRHGMKPIREDFDGDMVKVNSLRLRTFKEKGCTCVQCGLKATYFMKVRGNPTERWHFNLYADVQNGEEEPHRVLFTKDHIMPKSKGGPESIENMQTMCVHCNSKKGNSFNEPDTNKA